MRFMSIKIKQLHMTSRSLKSFLLQSLITYNWLVQRCTTFLGQGPQSIIF